MNFSSSEPRFIVAQLGARRRYAVPRALHSAGRLERLFTDFYGAKWPAVFLPRRLRERTAPDLPRERVAHFPLFGLRRMLRNRRAHTPRQRLRAYAIWNREFGRLVSRQDWGDAAAVYVFNAAGVEIAEEARRRGVLVALDQTAAPWCVEESLLAEERARWPDWEAEGASPEDWQPLAERERAEWKLAHWILCGSEYVRDSLRAAGGPVEKCRVVPYGVEPKGWPTRVREPHADPLRVLFVGTIQLRKGIPYLIEAMKMLEPSMARLRCVGPIRVSPAAVARLAEVAEIRPAVTRSQLPVLYDEADVLVLPSISEGSANVCYEALAVGLPVITTPNAGSVVRDGVDGFIVPIRSPEAIAARLTELARDRERLAEMSRNALSRAQDLSFAAYAQRLLAALRDLP